MVSVSKVSLTDTLPAGLVVATGVLRTPRSECATTAAFLYLAQRFRKSRRSFPAPTIQSRVPAEDILAEPDHWPHVWPWNSQRGFVARWHGELLRQRCGDSSVRAAFRTSHFCLPRQYDFCEVRLTPGAHRGFASRGQSRPVLSAHSERGGQP